MRWDNTTILSILLCVAVSVDAQARRLRYRPRPIQQQQREQDDGIDGEADDDNTPEPAIQYYSAEPQSNNGRVVLVSSDDDLNGYYGQPTTPPARNRVEYNRPSAKSTTTAPRTKEHANKLPPVQTIRNYSKVNDDGSFTFGYEAADGSFKEETRGTDCVVRGKYGYVDPDGNKREFTYVSGNPCDPNNPEGSEEEPERPEEESNEPENIPQNYPKRPIRPLPARPIHHPTTTPTTVFQNAYSSASYQEDDEREEPEPIQLLQQQRQRPVQHIHQSAPEEVAIRQRPRITVNTTPAPSTYRHTPTQQTHPVSITPRPTYRVPAQQTIQTQPPATTYRPSAIQFITQKAPSASYSYKPSDLSVEPITKSAYASTRKPVDFSAELQKFQHQHNVLATTTPRVTTFKPFKPSPQAIQKESQHPTSNPIYESQLVFDPSTGQYDSALYQQLPQTDGDFSLNHRIQPYVHQPQPFNTQPPHLISLEQLQQQAQQQPLYQRPAIQPTRQTSRPLQFPQFSQETYQRENENIQVLNSQQLFQQQQELQQHQLQQDRVDASKRQQNHRFQPAQLQRPVQQAPQGFYYVQPQESSGQIDAFLRGHNINDFN